MSNTVASDELRLLLERIERIEEDIADRRADKSDVFAEAKSRGFDTKTMREILKLRKMDPHERREREAMLDTYKAALGMLDGTPLGKWAVEKLSKRDEPASDDDRPGLDEMYETACQLVIRTRKASTSWLQRQLQMGFNSAAALIERMQREGIVSAPNEVGKREVLAPAPDNSEDDGDDAAAGDAEQEPEATVEDAHRMGAEAARAGAPVTANPFPAFDERRAAWDESWCAALGTDGMDIPDALKPAPKAKKGDAPAEDASK